MLRLQLLRCVVVVTVCVVTLDVHAQSRLDLGGGMARVGSDFESPLTLTTTDEVQGLVAVFAWESEVGEGVDLVLEEATLQADSIARRVEADFMILGFVVDSDGVGDAAIPPGENIALATAVIRITSVGTAPLGFVDGTYATVDGDSMMDGGPLLDNIVVVAGRSIGVNEGLSGPGLDEPPVTIEAIEAASILSVGVQDNSAPGPGTVPVLLENTVDVEGFVVALAHDPDVLLLTAVELGSDVRDSEFSATEISEDGGTLGAVFDFEAPFDGQVLSPGLNEVGLYSYASRSGPVNDVVETPLRFVDGVLGSPVKENIIVSGGRSIGRDGALVTEDGVYFLFPPPPGEDCTDGIDNDGDDLIDLEDPECFEVQFFACGGDELDSNGQPESIRGSTDSVVGVCFYIFNPEDDIIGTVEQFDHLQGFSMSVGYDCGLTASEEFDITGTILEAIGAEFISIQVDNDALDGDGCELIIGVLVDALPPFDGETIPPLPFFQKMGCVDFLIADDPLLCGTELNVFFADGLNGRGNVPVKNLVSAENIARSPVLVDCSVSVVNDGRFYRGDCNFSRNSLGPPVNVADSAATISFLFPSTGNSFDPPCLDACDCNDDGRIDLSDTVCILKFLFDQGSFPPAPGPGIEIVDGEPVPTPPGPDPTPDGLDCAAPGVCSDEK